MARVAAVTSGAPILSGNRWQPTDLIRLRGVMALTSGRPDVVVGVIDGPVALDHPDLRSANVHVLPGADTPSRDADSMAAYTHGTFTFGILAARRGAAAPAIAPTCTFLSRAVLLDGASLDATPSASWSTLAEAIVQCVDAGARLLNLSVTVLGSVLSINPALQEALEYTRRRGVLVVSAAGNQGMKESSTISAHPWLLPVVAYSCDGGALPSSGLSPTIGRWGIGSPGDGVVSLNPGGQFSVSSGTSIAAAFVTGTAALLWSLHPTAGPTDIKRAVLASAGTQRKTIIPPLLDAWRAYHILSAATGKGRCHERSAI